MIDRAVGIAGLAVTLVGLGVPIMAPNLSTRLAACIVGCGLILLGVAGGMLWLPVDAHAPSNSGIVAPGNNGIITQGQTGGTNVINSLPPKLEGKLYQNGQPVGDVAGVSVDESRNRITFSTIWDTSELVYVEPVKLRVESNIYTCRIIAANLNQRTLMGIAPNGQLGNNITPGAVCQIINVQ